MWWLAVHRTNTYPFIHMDVIHLIINLLGVTPMLERFEAENGTLTSIALFFGREYSWELGEGNRMLMGCSFVDFSGIVVCWSGETAAVEYVDHGS